MKKPAVFLDRDGTINIESGYIRNLDDFKLMPGAAFAIKQLNALDILAIVVTNQSGPARGFYEESWVHQLHARMNELLAAEDAHVDAIYYCPHLPEGVVPEYTLACGCRKPATGLIEQAMERYSVDLAKSYVVGDKATDVELAQNVGCRSVLLRSGYGEMVINGAYQWMVKPDHVAEDLYDAVNWIIDDLETLQ